MEENMAANVEATETESTTVDNATTTNDTPENTSVDTKEESTDKRARTKQYSDRINKIRSESDAKIDQLTREIEDYKALTSALKQNGYKSDNVKELLYEIKAEAEGKTIEEIKKADEEQALQFEQMIKQRPEIIKAEEIIKQQQLNNDLNAIKAVHPEVTATSPLELGDVFLRLMATGTVDALTAYEAQIAFENRGKKEAPKSIGDIKSTAGVEKDFYTPEEVDNLPDEAYNDPKIFEKIRKSMTKWR